ncbi:MAG: segregation/condensation protein A [Chloroflexota bacterium]|nr:segregation/condensation protein A [Chloroflexota bacterium]
MPLQPIPIVSESESTGVPMGLGHLEEDDFEIQLEMFAGPLQLLLHLIEARELDVLSVPLAEVADAYVAHLAANPVSPERLSEFVAVAAQLILLKSRRLLPAEPLLAEPSEAAEPDEQELRRRLIEYRALRDAARLLAARDGTTPLLRREPREGDLPLQRGDPVSAMLLVEALNRLAAIGEPVDEPPTILAREVTIAEQMRLLHAALSATPRLVLQSILGACRSRTEVAVTFLAALELIRRRQASAEQTSVFGPIVVERVKAGTG